MREYSSVSGRFWIGKTGKELRGDTTAQVLALYLMTSPHSNMIGVFHCPILYMSHETGIPLEGAYKALARLSEIGFCHFEEESETVFVVRMAANQVGEEIKDGDKRKLGVIKQLEQVASARMAAAFRDVYGIPYGLPKCQKSRPETKPLTSPFQAPPKQLTGTGAGTGSVEALHQEKNLPTERICESPASMPQGLSHD